MATLILFVCVYGFSSSSVTCLPPSVIGQFTPDEKLGASIGAFYSVIAIASLVGTPIGGALITDKEHKDGYRWLILFSVSTYESCVFDDVLSIDRGAHSLLAPCSCLEAGYCTTGIFAGNGRLKLRITSVQRSWKSTPRERRRRAE
jgi:MFS family permease